MNKPPILILQMQRMGDLILTFPLMGWLRASYPEHPLWVVGEEIFFETLLRLGPDATYFGYSAADRLAQNHFRMVINLSHRPEAAALAGRLQAEEHIGPVSTGGASYIHGAWQLYRASIVHNNRHNQFHWADLNALDLVPLRRMHATRWPVPQARPGSEGRIGLFLGASEPDKHPDAAFWAELTALLLKRGLKPVLLGGKTEVDLGRQVAGLLKAPSLNWCGKFSLLELADFLGGLSLLITPDTGPMHLAAWLGTPTLNLSLGPVNAWETAPAPRGHLVLRPSISCNGCWRCTQPSQLCRAAFTPKRVALAAQAYLHDQKSLADLRLPGLELFLTQRVAAPGGSAQNGAQPGASSLYGLFQLQALNPAQSTVRRATGTFWRSYFAWHHGLAPKQEAATAWQCLTEDSPALARAFSAGLARLAAKLSQNLRTGRSLPDDFWTQHPPMLRPLTGYLPLVLENKDFSRAAWAEALAQVAALADISRG